MLRQTYTGDSISHLVPGVSPPASPTAGKKLAISNSQVLLSGIVSPSGDTFLAVVFDSTKHRDSDLAILRKTPFKVDNKEVRVTAHNFGDTRYQKCMIWTVTLGPLGTAEDLLKGLQGYFSGTEFKAECDIRAVYSHSVENGTFSVRFGEPPPWNGKQISIGNPPVSRLVTAEKPGVCRFCEDTEHTTWECKATG